MDWERAELAPAESAYSRFVGGTVMLSGLISRLDGVASDAPAGKTAMLGKIRRVFCFR